MRGRILETRRNIFIIFDFQPLNVCQSKDRMQVSFSCFPSIFSFTFKVYIKKLGHLCFMFVANIQHLCLMFVANIQHLCLMFAIIQHLCLMFVANIQHLCLMFANIQH